MTRQESFDAVIAGGGLAGGLLALRLFQKNPNIDLALVERAPVFGGQQTWTFFGTDLPEGALKELAPLLDKHWTQFQVCFRGFSRVLDIPYFSIRSDDLHRYILRHIPARCLRAGGRVLQIQSGKVFLEAGEILKSKVIFDARGAKNPLKTAGWHKSMGWEITLKHAHNLKIPIHMDATVEQIDGFRSLSVLPLTSQRLFVRDTRYSSLPDVDYASFDRSLRAYVKSRGWSLAALNDVQEKAFPLLLTTPKEISKVEGVFPIGAVAHWYNGLSGHMVPYVMRFAEKLGSLGDSLDPQKVSDVVEAFDFWAEDQNRFLRRITRMMFWAARPEDRFQVFQNIFQMPDEVVGRFYSGQMTQIDRLRIISQRPPGKILDSLAVLPERGLDV